MDRDPDSTFASAFRLVESRTEPGRGRFAVEVVAGGPFFEGHFPGAPILPAVAQLVLIEALLRRLPGSSEAIVGIESLRLLNAISPADVIEVRLEQDRDADAASMSFEVVGERGPISQGRLLLRRAAPG